MNALGEWQGKPTAYDAGTGVIPAYRRQGIAEELFTFMVPHLKEASVEQYLLEVLTGNERAVALYQETRVCRDTTVGGVSEECAA